MNTAALRALSAWVPEVFGAGARYQAGTGAYRVPSRALGRALEEDLSLAPGGIVDFGVHDLGDARQGRRTAIDVVIEHGGAADAVAAALWLCGRMGIAPEALGRRGGRDRRHDGRRAAAASAGGERRMETVRTAGKDGGTGSKAIPGTSGPVRPIAATVHKRHQEGQRGGQAAADDAGGGAASPPPRPSPTRGEGEGTAVGNAADGTGNAGLVSPEATSRTPPPRGEVGELPKALQRPPGLVGEIAAWIMATARRPQAALALGAALAVVGTAAGRQVAGPTLSGTHLYVIGLAPTGAGKDHPLQCTGRLLRAAQLGRHVGPSEFISMPAVIRFMSRAPLSLCAMDEFGAFVRRINSKRASGFEAAVSKTLRTAWGSSFQTMVTPEWAGREAEELVAPALSIFGVSTEEEFYAALEGADRDNGVLNRFLLVSTRQRPAERDPEADPLAVPASIASGLRSIYGLSGELAAAQRNAPQLDRPPLRLAWGSDRARATYEAFSREIDLRADDEPMDRAFLARTVEMAVRLATIVAIGRGSGTLDEADIAFGRDLATWSAEAMIRGAGENIADTENQADANRVVRILRRHHGRIGRTELLRAMQHRMKARDLNQLLDGLIEAETILREDPAKTGGRPGVVYALP